MAYYNLKRVHSPSNETELTPAQHLRKRQLTEDAIRRFAALSLSSEQRHQQQQQQGSGGHGGGGAGTIVRIDDMDAFLAEDDACGHDGIYDDDIHIGQPELVAIAGENGHPTLLLERVPGSTELRIPDFVLNAGQPQDQADIALQQWVQHILKQYHTDGVDDQPMEID